MCLRGLPVVVMSVALMSGVGAVPVAAQQRAPAPVMPLPALLGLFQLPAGAPDGTILGWDDGSGPDSRIRWTFEGIREAPEPFQREGFPYHRIGLVVVDLNGVPAYTMTYQGRRVPGPWRVTLLGPRAGPFRVSILTEGNAEEMALDVPAVLRAAGWTVSPYRCSRETTPATFGHLVHLVEAPERKPIWLQESWNFGHATGMTISLHLLYFQDDADRVECIVR